MLTMESAVGTVRALPYVIRSGVAGVADPLGTGRMVAQLLQWGLTISGEVRQSAARDPDVVAIIDDRRRLTYGELVQIVDRVSVGYAELGIKPGSRVGLMTRNSADMVIAMVANATVGADTVLVNTGLAGATLEQVAKRQELTHLVVDEEFLAVLGPVDPSLPRVLAWRDDPSAPAPAGVTTTLDSLAQRPQPPKAKVPPEQGRIIVLTSGTTGTPKGARRRIPSGLGPLGSILSRIPLRANDTVLISAPVFHTWGYAAFQLCLGIRATMVLRRRFDPEGALDTLATTPCDVQFAVPVMIQRMMELPADVRRRHRFPKLRVIACSGSALPAELPQRVAATLGPVLYSLYGSTEVSWASIATPQDLSASPSCAGRPPVGTKIYVLDENNREVPPGTKGRIFVGNEMLFEGYTDAKDKDTYQGAMSTGDMGWMDETGLLHVAGREDDMIVSGGENVYPQAVEDVIAKLPGVVEVACVGVHDQEFGQRLAAFVVMQQGQELDAEVLREKVRSDLGRHLVPRDVTFIDSLPRNETGKVLRRKLVPST